MAEKWLTVAEACQSLAMTERTLRRRISQGRVTSKLENGRRLVLVEDAMTEDMARLQEENARLKQELEQARQDLRDARSQMDEASQRHDTIVLQLTRQLENQQRLLEYHEAPWWRRLFQKHGSRE